MLKELLKEMLKDELFSKNEESPVNAFDPKNLIDKYVIIRTYSAGVHFGRLEYYDAQTKDVVLSDARRIYKWAGAFTLSEVATKGIKLSESKLTVSIPFIKLTEIEIILCCVNVAKLLREAPAYEC